MPQQERDFCPDWVGLRGPASLKTPETLGVGGELGLSKTLSHTGLQTEGLLPWSFQDLLSFPAETHSVLSREKGEPCVSSLSVLINGPESQWNFSPPICERQETGGYDVRRETA